MRYEFHPEALEEYNEAGNYYAQKEPERISTRPMQPERVLPMHRDR